MGEIALLLITGAGASTDFDRAAYLVGDDMLARLALGLEQVGHMERVNLHTGLGVDLDKLRAQRDALASRATEVVKGLWSDPYASVWRSTRQWLLRWL